MRVLGFFHRSNGIECWVNGFCVEELEHLLPSDQPISTDDDILHASVQCYTVRQGNDTEKKEEKFDAAFTECIDICGYALFHLLGIEKHATTLSMALMDGLFRITQIPANTAYVPSMTGGKYGDQMSFMERLYNTLSQLSYSHLLIEYSLDHFQEVVGSDLEGENIRGCQTVSSLVFLNSDPLADFPKLTSSRVIDIGGISVHDGHKPLDEYWSGVLNLRNKTILISFGTWVKGYLMPQEYKETI
ncbi:hypothetical protein PENTCL1PPCAC_138, partial [Pristionchus entomophagus]